MNLAAAAAAAAILGIVLARYAQAAPTWPAWSESSEPEADQGATWWDDMQTAVDPNTYAAPAVSAPVASSNVSAFLQLLRYAEGTAGPDGYRTMFGGALFDSFDDHPRRAVQFRDQAGRLLWTSAAGAFQFMAVSPLPGGKTTRVDTWDRLQARLQLPDFSPASQDLAAIELIRERGALGDVIAGRVSDAVRKCAPVWASLPGAGYAQPERKLSALLGAYQGAGGILV
jgi:muramidase (phage lysozyme)